MTLKELLESKSGQAIVSRIFKAGFAFSGEGFNGEYGADEPDIESCLAEWIGNVKANS